jgi:hypothetical protein
MTSIDAAETSKVSLLEAELVAADNALELLLRKCERVRSALKGMSDELRSAERDATHRAGYGGDY